MHGQLPSVVVGCEVLDCVTLTVVVDCVVDWVTRAVDVDCGVDWVTLAVDVDCVVVPVKKAAKTTLIMH